VSTGPWSVEFERRADRDLGRLDPQVRQRVLAAIERLASDPRSAGLRRLSGRAESRLRVGDWRVMRQFSAGWTAAPADAAQVSDLGGQLQPRAYP